MNIPTVTPTIPKSATGPSIEVLVLPPHELPYVAILRADAQNGYLPAIQRHIAGSALEALESEALESEALESEALEPFPVATFDTHEDGTVGFCHAAIMEGLGSQLDGQQFPFNNRVLHLPYTLYGTCIVAAGSHADDLTSLTPELLDMLLDAFASGLEPAEYELVIRQHSAGAEYIDNWN